MLEKEGVCGDEDGMGSGGCLGGGGGVENGKGGGGGGGYMLRTGVG